LISALRALPGIDEPELSNDTLNGDCALLVVHGRKRMMSISLIHQ
jgi:hypothetical protein